MTRNDSTAVVRDLRTLLGEGHVGDLTDGQLLERFVDRREAAGSAFEVLLGRHGPMVWGVCRRILDDPNDAADAFQATFLILVKKASSVRVDDSLGRWLHGVSLKVAKRARSTAARRSRCERPGVDRIASPIPSPDRGELLAELDEEIGRLPEHYRSAVVLCDLGSLSHQEAARQLGCAVGTIGSRLSRARECLRGRLVRRGLAPSQGLGLFGLPIKATTPTAMLSSTSIAALRLVAGDVGLISTNVSFLSERTIEAMSLTRIKLAAGVALLATSGLIAMSYAATSAPKPSAPAAQKGGTPVARPAESPEEILARMIKTYAEAKSYQDEGEAVLVFQGEGPKRTIKRPFVTRFVRPKLFRYEYSERSGDGEDERNRYVIWTDGAPGRSKAWWTLQPEIRENPLALAVGTAAGVSGGTSTTVPNLLMPKEMPSRGSLGWLKEPRLVGEEAVEGSLCYKIEGVNCSNQPETTWVDKETYLLKKMFDRTEISKAIVEQTTTYRPRLNVEIPAEQFDFDPRKP